MIKILENILNKIATAEGLLIIIISGLVFLAITNYLFSPIQEILRSFRVTRELLKNNYSKRNNLRGEHLADRLLDIWDNGNANPLNSHNHTYGRGQWWVGRYTECATDKKLEDLGLVERYKESGQTKVKLKKELLTRLVIKYLSCFEKKGWL